MYSSYNIKTKVQPELSDYILYHINNKQPDIQKRITNIIMSYEFGRCSHEVESILFKYFHYCFVAFKNAI